jgi:hypothetical protein
VYFRREHYYIHPLAGSGGGDPALFMEPVTTLETDVDAAVLGNCVLQALQLSHHQAPWPTNWKNLTEPLLRAAGVKSESTFMKGSKSVRVDLDAGVVTIIYTTSKEYPDAASPQGEIKFPLGEARELGLMVMRGISLSD